MVESVPPNGLLCSEHRAQASLMLEIPGCAIRGTVAARRSADGCRFHRKKKKPPNVDGCVYG